MDIKSILKKALIAAPIIYLTIALLAYIDVNNSRPILTIFKNIQTDSALEIVDFSVDKPEVNKPKPTPNNDRNPKIFIWKKKPANTRTIPKTELSDMRLMALYSSTPKKSLVNRIKPTYIDLIWYAGICDAKASKSLDIEFR